MGARRCGCVWLMVALACTRSVNVLEREPGTGPGDGSGGNGTTSSTSIASTSDGTVGGETSDPPTDCSTPLPSGVPPPCLATGPSALGDPVLEWSWGGVGDHTHGAVAPLVGNLTDDDGDGVIDACDRPDVVVVAHGGVAITPDGGGRLFVLAGATGALQLEIDVEVSRTSAPALGDLDGDGRPEIVAVVPGGGLVALAADGSTRWTASTGGTGHVALADLDADGRAEIVTHAGVFTSDGAPMWSIDPPQNLVAADVDDDGDLELVGGRGFEHDGSLRYDAAIAAGWAQVADLDDDPDPEIVVTHEGGVTILSPDGEVEREWTDVTLQPPGPDWARPAAIADFDGDGAAELAAKLGPTLVVIESDGTTRVSIAAGPGDAGPSAFDLLGRGAAFVLLATDDRLFMIDAAAGSRVELAHAGASVAAYPVVADVDADGSAELVVVNDASVAATTRLPTVEVYGHRDGAWVGARRIWNQHAYAVTGIEEDGTIPAVAAPSWRTFNTFRANARLEDGHACAP